MIKYRVIRSDGFTEFPELSQAEQFRLDNNIQEPIQTIEEQPLILPPDNMEVACWRVKAILTFTGLKPAVEALIESFPEPNRTVAKYGWEEGNVFELYSPTVQAIKQGLGLTDEQIYQIFTQAKDIQA